jgi:hypothetical protein
VAALAGLIGTSVYALNGKGWRADRFGDWCVAVSHTLYHDNHAYRTLRVDNRSTTRDVQPARPEVLAVD